MAGPRSARLPGQATSCTLTSWHLTYSPCHGVCSEVPDMWLGSENDANFGKVGVSLTPVVLAVLSRAPAGPGVESGEETLDIPQKTENPTVQELQERGT